jgi:hypothetical protein
MVGALSRSLVLLVNSAERSQPACRNINALGRSSPSQYDLARALTLHCRLRAIKRQFIAESNEHTLILISLRESALTASTIRPALAQSLIDKSGGRICDWIMLFYTHPQNNPGTMRGQ